MREHDEDSHSLLFLKKTLGCEHRRGSESRNMYAGARRGLTFIAFPSENIGLRAPPGLRNNNYVCGNTTRIHIHCFSLRIHWVASSAGVQNQDIRMREHDDDSHSLFFHTKTMGCEPPPGLGINKITMRKHHGYSRSCVCVCVCF